MEFIGQSDRAAMTSGITGTGPLMISGDDVPHRLLYLRRVWGLGISPEDMSRAIETPDGVHFRHDSREQMWLEGWRQAWGCNELFYTRTLAENRVVDIPDQQPAEWFTAAGPDGVWDEKYRSWQVQISPVRNFRDRQTTLILRAEAAAARGLAAIYVVPVEGHWAASRGRILVVSPETFDSDAALIPVLDGV